MEHGLEYITFHVQKHLESLAICSNPLLVRDKPLGAPAFVILAKYLCLLDVLTIVTLVPQNEYIYIYYHWNENVIWMNFRHSLHRTLSKWHFRFSAPLYAILLDLTKSRQSCEWHTDAHTVLCLAIKVANKYSLLMHRIKTKSSTKFLWIEQNVFVGGFISFQSALTLAVLTVTKKAYRILAALSFKMSPPSLPWTLASTPWAYRPCNIFMAFKRISMMRSGHIISHCTATVKLSVHVWDHDLIWCQKQNWHTKTFPQDYD